MLMWSYLSQFVRHLTDLTYLEVIHDALSINRIQIQKLKKIGTKTLPRSIVVLVLSEILGHDSLT